MRRTLLLGVALTLLGYAFGQICQEMDGAKGKLKGFSTSFNNEERIFVQDSVHVYNSSGKLKARELNFFNSDNLESYSWAFQMDYNGKESFIAIDSFFYDNKKNLELHKIYNWVDGEWQLMEYKEHYWNDFRKKDSTNEMKFDPILAEWRLIRKQKYAYDEEGSLIEMGYYAWNEKELMLLPDMKFVYSDFIGIDKPKKAVSSLYREGEWRLYMNQYNEYDEKKRLASNIFKMITETGEDNVKKTEWTYNDNDQITEELGYGVNYVTKQFEKVTLIKNVYDSDTHCLVADSSFSYNPNDNVWRYLTGISYFWREIESNSIFASEYGPGINAYYDALEKQIHIQADEPIWGLSIYSIEGCLVMNQNLKEVAPLNKYTLLAGDLCSGIYIVKMNFKEKSVSKKIQIHE